MDQTPVSRRPWPELTKQTRDLRETRRRKEARVGVKSTTIAPTLTQVSDLKTELRKLQALFEAKTAQRKREIIRVKNASRKVRTFDQISI